LNQEQNLKKEFIHYCIKCGAQLILEQETFSCSNCGSTTFKLKKVHKEIKKTEENSEAHKEFGEPYLPAFHSRVTENQLESKGEKLETVRAQGFGVFEIDVEGLMGGKPLILSVQDGIYEISIQKLMEKVKKKVA
jgi:predicted  nucleic acid-binding Zn-ribbon protein